MNPVDRQQPRNAAIKYLLPLLLALAGCGGSGTADAESPANAQSAGPGSSAQSCIATYVERPCELLAEDVVRRHVTAPADIEQTDVAARLAKLGVKPRSSARVAQNGCSYTWSGGRTRARRQPGQPADGDSLSAAPGALNKPLPIDDTVAFKAIRVLDVDDPLARFERTWRAPTAEERERLAARMDERMKEAQEKGEVSRRGARVGQGLGRSMANASMSYEPVDGVGTAARWGGLASERSLMVLDGNTEFAVLVNVSDDEAKNRELAVAIARDLLARCGN